MNYSQTLDWMFAQLPMYQRQGASAYKVDISNTLQLAAYIGNPEKRFKSIHVAGTNGKGSTSHMLASILQEAGYTVGLYTSPHLKDFRERIRLNGKKITEQYVIEFIAKHKVYFEKNSLSFFEMTVGMAFQYFADSAVDIAIIEVGLGGRLDSTNIITPEVSVITNIGLDHTQFLGNTLAKIASEKAGIIKKEVPVVIGRTTPETKQVFEQVASASSSTVFYGVSVTKQLFETDLKGGYQQENCRTVIQVLNVLQDQGWDIHKNDIQKGFARVVYNTGLLGRWQILQQKPKVICDTAHNEDGLSLVMEQLVKETYEQLHVVLGVVSDKDLGRLLPLFPKEAKYYFAKPAIKRGLEETKLKKLAEEHGLIGAAYGSVKSAYNEAVANSDQNDLIYIGGSTFVVAEII